MQKAGQGIQGFGPTTESAREPSTDLVQSRTSQCIRWLSTVFDCMWGEQGEEIRRLISMQRFVNFKKEFKLNCLIYCEIMSAMLVFIHLEVFGMGLLIQNFEPFVVCATLGIPMKSEFALLKTASYPSTCEWDWQFEAWLNTNMLTVKVNYWFASGFNVVMEKIKYSMVAVVE